MQHGRNGRTVTIIEGALDNLGIMLERDPAMQAKVHDSAETILRSVLPSAQARLADFIAQVVGGWDAATITDRLELRVGKDLQFVRVNGTLVGFLVGGLLYGVLRFCFGAALP